LSQPVAQTLVDDQAIPALDFAVQSTFQGSSTPDPGRGYRLLR
jgi:hypothetical protein